MSLPNIKDMSFEEALNELKDIVKKIDTGQETLESSINIFERGVLLRDHCEQRLNAARLKIDKLTKSENSILLEKIDL